MFHNTHLIALNRSDFLTDTKDDDNSVYLSQPHAVQIIELVECPPPPRNLASVIYESSASSSYASSSTYSTSLMETELEDEEEVCESYCSSDDAEEQDIHTSSTDTYSLRMKRILAWRENFSVHLSATLSEPTLPSSLKRKLDYDDDHDDDMASQSSKRSRSSAPSIISGCSLGMHSCPACDASFDTEQSLRQHGTDATANEACSAAVKYAFE